MFPLLLISYYCSAQDVDVNGMYIGQIYTRQQVVDKFGEPDYVYSGRINVQPEYHDMFRGWCQYCKYGDNLLQFDEESDGTFCGFNIYDKGFVVMKDYRKGGFRIGDEINANIIENIFNKCIIEEFHKGYWKIWFGDWAIFWINTDNGIIVSMSFEIIQ